MSVLKKRSIEILKIIVKEYIDTWEVIWSKLLLKKYDLWVSSATVRNDMAFLETLELIYQPYNSAWRLPTSKWLRAFVNYLMEQMPSYFLSEKWLDFWSNQSDQLWDLVHKVSYHLAKTTKEISFFIVPKRNICEYCWLSNFLTKNYNNLWENIYCILDMLEDKFSFIEFIESFPLQNRVNVFIWEENILSFLKDYTIILKPVIISWEVWYVWIIWSLRMNYNFNISSVRGII